MKDFSNIIKEFDKIFKVPYVKSIPKREPTSSYYHLVGCIAEFMMRSDEHSRHMHRSYTEKTDPSSNGNVTDEDESKEIIVQETLSENNSKGVSESERNIVHETLSQNNSADVPDNGSTELKDNEHIEPSVIDKGSSFLTYFSAVEIYWVNWMLRTNGRSRHHQYKKDYINHLHYERDTMIKRSRVLSK